mmetsp:Transcript_86668/g.240332  ORF Transcript_86668/g.240332 Transcript_86668/m.240332 type:complete len:238 (-) Transcript_86668:150-863(-)
MKAFRGVAPLVNRDDSFPHVAAEWDAEDAASQPLASRPLLLYGSSILRLWKDAAGHWDPLPTLNRAFGGSRTWEAVLHFERGVSLYCPRVIIFYCGSNDITFHVLRRSAEDEAVAEIVGNTKVLVRAVARIGAQMIVCSVIKAPQKRSYVAMARMVDLVNSELRALCSGTEHAEFVDLNPHLEDHRGQPLADLYLPDQLHYLPEAYVRIHAALRDAALRRWVLADDTSGTDGLTSRL